MCAEWQLRDFQLTTCGARVTWRVWNYCPNSPDWIKFNINDLGTVTPSSGTVTSNGKTFNVVVTANDADMGNVKTLGFVQTTPLSTSFTIANSPLQNWVDLTFEVSTWPGADYVW